MSLQYCSKWRLVSAWGLLQRHAPRYHVYGINLFLHWYAFGFTRTFLINCIFQTLPSPVFQINFEKPRKRFRKEGETVSQPQRNTLANPRISETVLLQELHKVCPTAAVFTVKAGFPCQQLSMRDDSDATLSEEEESSTSGDDVQLLKDSDDTSARNFNLFLSF
ncbi:PREDICTED: uncharacterized protein LOC109580826 [Amphimedon queenslandica]|uniref:Uncharacterized protein n=1 Tax=Amphimedon queenslandica TaxID=400682 RepID=A0AAN0IYT5_AMPQE|nr:PREDICTED: uncharacterized protein LOC109580826 [Amphimedon queenslandica]|eukprot:XP_019849929.1 PREDICTED: uncharacterized protein LOC109580826 [Amphimedon queenslandica]